MARIANEYIKSIIDSSDLLADFYSVKGNLAKLVGFINRLYYWTKGTIKAIKFRIIESNEHDIFISFINHLPIEGLNMKFLKTLLSKISLIAIISVFATSSALAAGATVTIAGASIPTLSGTMLVVLSLLLFVVAFRIAKQKNGAAEKLFLALLGVSVIAMGGGMKLISETNAGSADVLLTPGTSTYRLNPGFNGVIVNSSSQDITVISIQPDPDSTCAFAGEDSCGGLAIPLVAPITLNPDQSCFIRCNSIAD